jgi:hypothetical protein
MTEEYPKSFTSEEIYNMVRQVIKDELTLNIEVDTTQEYDRSYVTTRVVAYLDGEVVTSAEDSYST